MTLDVQLQTMVVMIAGGFYLGISLDTFRRFSPYWTKKPVWTYILECCFWLSQMLILFYVLYLVNAGELRLYIFAACLLGFAMYQVIAASFYKRLLEKIIRLARATYRFLASLFDTVVFRPIKWLVYTFLSIALFCIRLLVTIILFFLKPVLKLIVHLIKATYHRLPERFKKIFNKFAGFYSIIEKTYRKWITFLTFKGR